MMVANPVTSSAVGLRSPVAKRARPSVRGATRIAPAPTTIHARDSRPGRDPLSLAWRYTADSSLNVPVLSPIRSTGTPSLFSSVWYKFDSGVPAG